MADKELWNAFEKTGSVLDYLNYKGITTEFQKQELGEDTVESVNHSDRDDTVRHTYR